MDNQDFDELFEEAAKLVISEGVGSTSLIQRRLEVGYARAARMLDQLEQAGIIAPSDGNRPREVIISSFEDIPIEFKERKPVKYSAMSREEKFDWSPKKISSSFAGFQKEYKNSKELMIPVGVNSKGKIASFSLSEVGHVYVFSSPLCKANELLKNMIEAMLNTYHPDVLKIIMADEMRFLTSFNGYPHLLTEVIVENKNIQNALGWTVAEIDKRVKMFHELGVDSFEEYNKTDTMKMPRIVCVINDPSGSLMWDDLTPMYFERLIALGYSAGIHLIVCSPLKEKKYSNVLTSFPTKIIFKTFSTNQADTLGTDDAFDLQSPDDFLLVPAYGKVEKLRVK